MNKFLFYYLLFFLLWGTFSAEAHEPQDTLVAIGQDTTATSEQDSVSVTNASYDSLYQPVPDSLFSFQSHIREVPGNRVSGYKNNPDYAYANNSEYWRKDTSHEPDLLFRILNNSLLRWIFLALVAGVILYGVYQLVIENNFALLIRAGRQKLDQTDQELSVEKIDFDEFIRISQSEGNYRMAVRYLYLRLIYSLRKKSGISFQDSSSNSEISYALGNHPESANFRWLATAYEYVFYGGFIPNHETYSHLKNRFDALQKIFSD